MITCPLCNRFVRVERVIVNGLGDVERVVSTCKRHGKVDANWTDYDELNISDDENDYVELCDCGEPFPSNKHCPFCGAHARY